MERSLPEAIGNALRTTRQRLRMTQRGLAAQALVPQSTICRVERGQPVAVTVQELGRLFDALSTRLEVIARPPLVEGGLAVRDVVHAHILRYVERALRRIGFDTVREVPIGGDRVRGWIDLLAWRSIDRVVVLVEVKGDLLDVGAFERQMAWYEHELWRVARGQGWRPSRVIVAALLLATQHNAEVTRREADALRRRFPMPPADLRTRLQAVPAPEQPLADPGTAGRLAALAFVDPMRRGRGWLLPTPLYGGRPVLPYQDAQELRARLEAGRPPRGAPHRRA